MSTCESLRRPDRCSTCSGACRTCAHLVATNARFVMVGRVEYAMHYGCTRHNGVAPHASMDCPGYEREPGADDDGVPAPDYRGPRCVLERMPPPPKWNPDYVHNPPRPEPMFTEIFAVASAAKPGPMVIEEETLLAWEEEERGYAASTPGFPVALRKSDVAYKT